MLCTKVPRDSLFALLGRRLISQELWEIAEVLRPFYIWARKGNCSLKLEHGPNEMRIAEAIKEVLGLKQMPKIVFRPISEARNDVRTTLGDRLRDVYGDRLKAKLGDKLRRNLSVSLENILMAELDVIIKAILGDCSEFTIGGNVRDSLRSGIFFYLGFCLAKDEEMARMLAELLKAQTNCWAVVGRITGDPNTWVVQEVSTAEDSLPASTA